jgi:hypothetical protein
MFVPGYERKYPARADVVRFTPGTGHRAAALATSAVCRKEESVRRPRGAASMRNPVRFFAEI